MTRTDAAKAHWREILARYPLLTSDDAVHDGQPCIGHTRIPVAVVIDYLPMGEVRLLSDFPDLDGYREAMHQAVCFMLELLGEESVG